MADYSVKAKAEDIPWEFQAEFGDAAEKERLAQLMMQQRALIQKGMQPQMVSGHYIRMSPMQGLADMLAAYWGGKASREASGSRANTARRMAAAENTAVTAAQSQYGGGREVEADPIGAESSAMASPWERVRGLGKGWAENRRALNTAAGRNLTGAGSAQMAMTGQAPTDQTLYKKDEAWSDPMPIPGVKTPEGKEVWGQKNVYGQWRELGSDRAPKQSVSVLNAAPEKNYIQTAQEALAKTDTQLYNDALQASGHDKALTRIEKVLGEGPVTAGPEFTARAELAVRNLLSQYGVPVNKAMDSRNARMTAEGATLLAHAILSGGRAITDQDRQVIAQTFPGISSGIPYDAMPAFISQLRMVNAAKMRQWQTRYQSLPEEYKRQYPATFGEYRSMQGGGWSDADEKRLQELEAKQRAGTIR